MSLGFRCPASSVKVCFALIEGGWREGNTMTVFVIRGALGAMLVATSSWAGAQALNVRLGGWDMTMSLAMNGGAPKVSPYKTCLTKEDLEGAGAFQKDESCTYKISARTPTRMAGSSSCKNDQGQTRGDFEIVAASPETIVMKTTSKGSIAKGGAVDMRMEVKGRWASASCKGYDD